MNSRKRQQIGTTFVVLSVILICFCFSLAPLCFSAPTEGQEQGPTTNSNNLDKASSSAEEFTTYIKNPSTQGMLFDHLRHDRECVLFALMYDTNYPTNNCYNFNNNSL